MQRSKEQAREQILKLVEQYYIDFHTKKPYEEGDRIPYAARMYGSEEMVSLVDSALEFWLTSGRYTKEFEDRLCKLLDVRHSLLVNSGSSANLLAFSALTSPLLGDRRIERGDEVITVAASFPTTVTPIIQYGAVPVFVDVTIPQYNIDVDMLKEALSKRTKAVMIAHTLGNPFNLERVKDFCDRHKLWLVEDNCDALGSKYSYKGQQRFTGTIGDIGTSSFYPPHHITMGEGGAVYTNNALLNKIMLSIRDWGRDCVCPSGMDNLCKHRFSNQYGTLPQGYDHKYVYSHFGYNLKVTDMQAAIGVEQLKRVADFSAKRQQNHDYLFQLLQPYQHKLILPQREPNSSPSWFGFLITCKDGVNRNRITEHLESNGIQTRLLFAGNLIRQPCFDQMRASGQGYRVVGELTNTDRIMHSSFWVGVYPGMSRAMLEKMARVIIEAI